MRKRIWIAVAVSLGACATPNRNNPNDPLNRPVASLSLYVGTFGGATSGTRTTEFILDVSDSKVPTGTPEYSFDLDGDGVFDPPATLEACPRPGQPIGCLRTTLAIPPGVLPGGIGAYVHTVRVTLDNGRVSDTASATATIVNSAPVVPAELDLFAPERTRGMVPLGFCGDAEACKSVDPDLDPLAWSWQLLRGDLEGGVLTGGLTGTPSIDHAPFGEQTLLFRATVNDGLATASTLVRVNVTTVVWVTSIFPNRVYRVFPDFRSVAQFPLGPGLNFVAEDGGLFAEGDKVWMGLGVHDASNILFEGDVRRMVRAPNGDLEAQTTWSVAGAFAPSSLAAAGGTGCAAFRTHTDSPAAPNFTPPSFFARLNGTGAAGTVVQGPDADALGEEPAWVFPGPPGSSDCWAVTRSYLVPPAGPASVYRLDASAALTPLASALLDDVTAASLAEDGALWLAGARSSCAGVAVARLANFGASAQSFCVGGSGRFDALAAHPDSGMWAHEAATHEIFHLTTAGAAVATGAPPIALPPTDNPSGGIHSPFFPDGEPRMVSDPLERRLWMVDVAQGALVRLREENGLLVDEQSVPGTILDFGTGFPAFSTIALWPATGRLLATVEDGTSAALAIVPSHLHRTEEVFVSSQFVNTSIDPRTGDAWVATGHDGSEVHRLALDGQVKKTYSLSSGDHAWGPAALPDGGAWLAIESASGVTGSLVRIDAAGVEVQRLPTTKPAFRVAEMSGNVCAVAQNSLADPTGYALRRPPAGALTEKNSAGAPWDFPLAVAATPTACWYTFFNSSNVVFDDGSTFLDTTSVPRPSFVSVDPVTGLAWVDGDSSLTTSSRSIWTVDAFGVSNEVLVSTSGSLNAVAVRRHCPASGACDAAAPLSVWVVQDQEVRSVDSAGNIASRFFLPNSSVVGDFEVLP